MTRVFAVVNATAGGGRTSRLWPRVRDALAASGARLESAQTSGPRDGARLAAEAATAGWPVVLAVGGDGTLNEVVDGVVSSGVPAAVAAVMTGRGRDACRNVGLARGPLVAARRVVRGTASAIDVGIAEWPDGTRRCFVNAAGAGLDAAVARRAARARGTGTWPYLKAVLVSIATHRPVDARLTFDGGRDWRGRLSAVVAANGPYFGGGMKIAPAAVPDDGRLDVVVLGDLGPLLLVRWLPTVYWGGHLRSSHVTLAAARQVHVAAATPLPVQLDGEPAPATPVSFGVLPGAVRLIR